jgi:hypothetical protein
MKGHWCRCCGLGLAFANFSGVHAHWNFYSAHVHADWIEDNQGWLVSNPQQGNDNGFTSNGRVGVLTHSPWLDYTARLDVAPELRWFAYKVDDEAQKVRIKIRMRMRAPSALNWTWDLEYELTYEDYDELLAQGRLRLNDYEVSATHSGNPLATAGFNTPVATNTQDGWGDIVLVYPKFGEDWTGKKLVVTAATDTPVKNTNAAIPVFGYNVPINLSWLVGTNHEFVFDESTFVELNTEALNLAVRPRYYESTLSGDGFKSFKVRHYSIVDNIFNGPAATAQATIPPEAYPRFAAELSFDTAGTFGGSPVAENVSMRWQISHIWWKAFEDDGVVVTTEHKSPATANNSGYQAPVATPVLFTRQLDNNRWGLTEYDQNDQSASIFPITYTLSLVPLD